MRYLPRYISFLILCSLLVGPRFWRADIQGCEPPAGFVTPEMFNGDGLDGSDDTDAIIDAISESNLYLCPGHIYHISRTIEIPSNRTIQSEQDNKAQIVLARHYQEVETKQGREVRGFNLTADSLFYSTKNELDDITRRKVSTYSNCPNPNDPPERIRSNLKCKEIEFLYRIVGFDLSSSEDVTLANFRISIEMNKKAIAVPILIQDASNIEINRTEINEFGWMLGGIMIDGSRDIDIYDLRINEIVTGYCVKDIRFKPQITGIVIDDATNKLSSGIEIHQSNFIRIRQEEPFRNCRWYKGRDNNGTDLGDGPYGQQADGINIAKSEPHDRTTVRKAHSIHNNLFEQVDEGIDTFGQDSFFYENTFRTVCSAFKINHGASHNRVVRNQLFDVQTQGILLTGQGDGDVVGNTIYGNIISGVRKAGDMCIEEPVVAAIRIAGNHPVGNYLVENVIQDVGDNNYWLHCTGGYGNYLLKNVHPSGDTHIMGQHQCIVIED